MASQRFYRESGRVEVPGFVILVASSVVGGAVGGFVYGVVSQVNPFVFVNFFVLVGAVFAAGMGSSLGQNLGKVRSTPASMVAGFVAGLLALYSAWVGWIWALSGWEHLLLSPAQLWGAIGQVSEVGAWSIRGGTPSGAVLWVLWALEALLLVGGATLISTGDGLPFCEDCREWAGEERTADFHPAESTEELVKALEGEDYAAFLALARASAQAPVRYVATATRCPRGADGPYFLSLEAKVLRPDAQGTMQESSYRLLRNLYVDAAVYEFVGSGGAAPEAGPPAEPADAA